MDTPSSYTFKAIKGGLFKARINHVPVRRLQTCLKYLTKWNRLAEAIVYSMVTPVNERWSTEWQFVYRVLDLECWDNIAVYSLTDKPTSFNDVVVVDFSVLRGKDKDSFLKAYPYLSEMINSELRLITYS